MRKSNFFKIITSTMAFAMLLGLASCSNKLPDETLPPPTTTTESTTETTVESTAESTETTKPAHGPNSTPVVTERPVDIHGQLSVKGTDLVDKNGEKVQLKGMSSYVLNASAYFWNAEAVKTLAQDWGCSILRVAVSTEGGGDGYVSNPDKYLTLTSKIIDLCVDQGIYVLIDWHILPDGDPNEFAEQSEDFFTRISALYKDCPNVIYEVCNEPNGKRFDDQSKTVDWKNTVKPYAERIIKAIRKNDPDNVIIVGTPTWSQDVDIASKDPIKGDNLMYTLHFYAGSHGQDLRDKLLTANKNGCAVFVTEWGTTGDSGGGPLFLEETQVWLDFLEEHNISWCNWSIGSPASENSNALKFASKVLTIEEKYQGHWPDEFISDSGKFVRDYLLKGVTGN